MLGFRPLASQPLASGAGLPLSVSGDQVYGGWLPIKYLDREGQEVGLDKAPAQIARDLAAEQDKAARAEIQASVISLLEQIAMQRELEDNFRAIAYLDGIAQELRAAEREAERLRWITDPRVIEVENENAISALLLEGLV